MITDIYKNIDIIERSISWAEKYGKESFPVEVFKEYRRKLRKIGEALSENCSAAAYGESQVGKSYLMSSLLSTPDTSFVIENDGKEYIFVDDINPSGGNNSQNESTGVITRFTLRQSNPKMSSYVKVTNLSVVDIILLLVDSYYNDVKIDVNKVLIKEQIDERLTKMSHLWESKSVKYDYITEDDVRDICEYIAEIIGNNAANISRSNYCNIIAPVICYVNPDKWYEVFGLLWNNNEHLNNLFSLLVSEYRKLGYNTEVYVPFDAVLRSKGTLLKIDWLDNIFGIYNEENSKDEKYTNVYGKDGELLCEDYSKAFLSALICELTFVLPEDIAKERKFLEHIDLLDFPGARSREKINEFDLNETLPQILRRGKVAYLFNKYSRSLKISSVLFSHHSTQKSVPELGSMISSWIDNNIGRTPEERTEMLTKTEGVAPLFMICTKFNIDLERNDRVDKADDPTTLDNHWNRFNKTIPEIILSDSWMEKWVKKGGLFSSEYFRNVYLLRDFYWSQKSNIFDGYNDATKTPEQSVHHFEDYENYFEELKESFKRNTFVKNHFSNAEQAWNDVATVQNDGSKAIIRNLDRIAGVLEGARRDKYEKQLNIIKSEIVNKLSVYYESDDKEENNKKLRQVIGDIKLQTAVSFGAKPELFGQVIDSLMVAPADIRGIAYDVKVRHTDTPIDVTTVIMIRTQCGIDINDSREVNVTKLCDYYYKEEAELEAYFESQGLSIDIIVSGSGELLTTEGDVIAHKIVLNWNAFINERVKELSSVLPHGDEVAFMLLSLLDKLGVKKYMAKKIQDYHVRFNDNCLPNAIADFASLTLNNFVSTMGRDYMSDVELDMIRKKADMCQIKIDLSPAVSSSNITRQPLLDVLTALDRSNEEVNRSHIGVETLRMLPFWGSFQRWENFVTMGLLYSSDISHVDPIANAAVRSLIEEGSNLYKK